MNLFSPLDAKTDVYRNYFLEASAGTGKTFSIENIVARLLIEEKEGFPPLSLENILIVTFTKEATKDLKSRIRRHLLFLYEKTKEEKSKEGAPDYLVHLFEDDRKRRKVKQRIEKACLFFHEAEIFTIHSFCYRLLQEFRPSYLLEVAPKEEIKEIIHDFFRVQKQNSSFTTAQITKILQEKKTTDFLENDLLNALEKGLEIEQGDSLEELQSSFFKEREILQKEHGITEEFLKKKEEILTPLFKKPEGLETVKDWQEKKKQFISLFNDEKNSFERFDDFVLYGDVFHAAFSKELQKKGKENQDLTFLTLFDKWYQIWERSSHPNILFASLCYQVKQYVQEKLELDEKGFYDDLIKKVERLSQNPEFKKQVENLYQAVIIDEFQDTDPLQWKIFSELFSKKSYFYLVGDPKQSIYLFRRADIYTYLKAMKEIGEDSLYYLGTNYRSSPSLVKALNALFSEDNCPGWLSLPKLKNSLPFHPVLAGKTQEFFLEPKKEAIHFFLYDFQDQRFSLQKVEEEAFFPIMVQEILSLKQEENIPFNEIAILVRDRHQALRVSKVLERAKIPHVSDRKKLLQNSLSWTFFRRAIEVCQFPENEEKIKAFFLSPLVGWGLNEIMQLSEEKELEKKVRQFLEVKEALVKGGIVSFFKALCDVAVTTKETFLENLLKKPLGVEWYEEIRQITSLVVSLFSKKKPSFQTIFSFLDEKSEETYLSDPTKQGVKIQTIHGSKGLEYGVVFTIGLISRANIQESLIPIQKQEEFILYPFVDLKESETKSYFLENDAEKLRQLYVAFTRAKYRLYVFASSFKRKEVPIPGISSSIELYLARFGKEIAVYEDLYLRMESCSLDSLVNFIDEKGKENHISYEWIQSCSSFKNVEKMEVSSLVAPKEISLLFPEKEKTSFSKWIKAKNETFFSYEKKDQIDTLPSNAKTGSYLHSLLEKTSFSSFQTVTSFEEGMSFIPKEKDWENWHEEIVKILFHTLKKKIKIKEKSFSFFELSEETLLKEFSFSFLYETSNKTFFIQGVVDLVFQLDGKEYIVDWKSNYLGEKEKDYQKEKMIKCMEERDYFFQAAIYKEAWKRHKKNLSLPEDGFGGVLYVFLRGMESSNEKEEGYLFFDPENFEKMI